MSIIDHPTEFAPPRHRLPRLVPSDEEISEVVGRPIESVLADGDLQRIAALGHSLTYGDMKAWAAGVLGTDATAEQIIQLADKFYDWCGKTKVDP